MRPSRRKPALPANDPLIDSLLEEVLGGVRPPNLRERILLSSETAGRETAPPVRPPNLPGLVAPPVQEALDRPQVELVFRSEAGGRRARQRRFRRLASLIVQSVVLVAGVVLALAALPHVVGWRANNAEDVTLASSSSGDSSAETDATTSTSETSTEPTPGPEAPDVSPSPAAAVPSPPEEDWQTTQLADASGAMNLLPPGSAAESEDERLTVVQRIDQYWHQAWKQAHVEPSPAISDAEWCERIYENLLGRAPSDAELAEFSQTAPERRREALIDHLDSEPEHREEFAQHWAAICASQLLRSALDEAPSTRSFRGGLEHYLRAALLRNEGFDRIVVELLTAEGSNSRSEKDYHGATNYLLALADGSGVRPTVEVCRVLLGRNAQCAQCHDDPHSDLRQEDFWQFAAFFRQTELQSLGAGRFRLTDQDFDGDLVDGVRVAGTVGYQQPDGSWQRVAPAFPGGEPIRSEGRVQDRTYRHDLARQLIASDDLSRALVNRLWSQFFQYGLTTPVDDMGRHNPGAHSELLDELADEFVSSGWDLRQLTRWILLSDPFTRSQVITEANARDVPHDGTVPLFSRMYYRPASFSDPMHALAQLIQSPVHASPESSQGHPRDSVAARVASSLDPKGDEAEESARVLSSLTATGQQLTFGQRQLIETWAASQLSPEQIVQHVFRCVLGRAPRGDEIQLAQKFCHSMKDDRRQGVESLVWALVNTQEFVRDH